MTTPAYLVADVAATTIISGNDNKNQVQKKTKSRLPFYTGQPASRCSIWPADSANIIYIYLL